VDLPAAATADRLAAVARVDLLVAAAAATAGLPAAATARPLVVVGIVRPLAVAELGIVNSLRARANHNSNQHRHPTLVTTRTRRQRQAIQRRPSTKLTRTGTTAKATMGLFPKRNQRRRLRRTITPSSGRTITQHRAALRRNRPLHWFIVGPSICPLLLTIKSGVSKLAREKKSSTFNVRKLRIAVHQLPGTCHLVVDAS